MENPFKELRLEDGLSQYEIARRAKVSKHAVLRLEQGMYDEPLPTLLNYFVENYPVPRPDLIAGYHAFQVETRVNNALCLRDLRSLYARDWVPSVGHPLVWLRERVGLNPTSLAKALCISQTVVAHFEKFPVTQKSVPEQLLNALKDNGYHEDEINYLISSYETYRQWYLARERELHAEAKLA